MTDSDRASLEHSYAVGNHEKARRIAQKLALDPLDAEGRDRALFILRATDTDWFLSAVGGLGLGLTAWLVYNYVL